MRKSYLRKSVEEIVEMENRYNFIPVETNETAAQMSLSRLCVRTVKDIASLKTNDKPTSDMEKNLKEYRDYAVENLDNY